MSCNVVSIGILFIKCSHAGSCLVAMDVHMAPPWIVRNTNGTNGTVFPDLSVTIHSANH